MSAGRRPDYRLSAMYGDGTDKVSNNIGAAWVNTDGTVSIRLDGFINLQSHYNGEAVKLRLFPNVDAPKPRRAPKQESKSAPPPPADDEFDGFPADMDDDLPF